MTDSCENCGKETENRYLSFHLSFGWVCERCKDYWVEHGELPAHSESLEGFL